MNALEHQHLSAKEIFLKACEFADVQQRGDFLERACAGDVKLRRSIEAMMRVNCDQGSNPLDRLEAMLGPAETIDTPVLQAPRNPPITSGEQPEQGADQSRPHSDDLLGKQIDRYRLLEQIGEGGMGVVFMAEQREPMRRMVALKVIKPGMDSRNIVARFEAERQALALMNHPSIAKVLDAGTTQSGRPYFVMELVRGIPITAFCDRHKLELRARLELFVKVCSAVQHAHQKGVIHRDLKPSNILVGKEDVGAVPMVIDFGVAKATAQSLTSQTLFTGFTQMIGTPLYMSPEQAEFNNIDVDTRSDIYSLGVMLYELVTGTLPFEEETFRKAGFDEMRRLIREVEPARPSHRISTLDTKLQSTVAERFAIDERRLQRQLRGELDWIVMKTLEKDRSRRYESASALAADLERYLRSEPVEACPPTLRYRYGKFIQRYRVPLAVSLALVAILAVGLITALWQANLARTASKQAEEQREKAEQHLQLVLQSIDRLLVQVAQNKLLNEPHMDDLRKRLLQDALSFLEALVNYESKDSLVQLRTAQASRRMALMYRRVGELNKSVATGRDAIARLEALDEKVDIETVMSETARAYAGLAASELALTNVDEAERLYRKSIEVCHNGLRKMPNSYAIKTELAFGLRGLSMVLSSNRLQSFAEAEKFTKEAIDVWEALIVARPDDLEVQSHAAAEYHNLASGMLEQRRLAQAEKLLQKAIELQEKAASAGSISNAEYLGNHYYLLSRVQEQGNRLAESIATLEKCKVVRTKLSKDHPDIPSFQVDTIATNEELAFNWSNRNEYANALACAEQALAECEDLVERFPNYRVNLANAVGCLATIEMRRPEGSKHAMALLEKEIEIDRKLHADDPRMAAYAFNLAGALSNLATLGDSDEDEQRYREALQLTADLIEDYPDSPDYFLRYSIIALNLSGLLLHSGKYGEGIDILRQAHLFATRLHERSSEVPEYEATYASIAGQLALGLMLLGERDEAKNMLDLAEPLLKRHAGSHVKTYEYIRARWMRTRIMPKEDLPQVKEQLAEIIAEFRELVQTQPETTAFRAYLAMSCLDLVETISSDSSHSTEERSAALRPYLDEGIKHCRELLALDNASFLRVELRTYLDNPVLLSYKSFQQLASDLKQHPLK